MNIASLQGKGAISFGVSEQRLACSRSDSRVSTVLWLLSSISVTVAPTVNRSTRPSSPFISSPFVSEGLLNGVLKGALNGGLNRSWRFDTVISIELVDERGGKTTGTYDNFLMTKSNQP